MLFGGAGKIPFELPSVQQYEGKWVALSDDGRMVYGSGDTASDALKDAASKGHVDSTLFYVRSHQVFGVCDGMAMEVCA